MFLVKPSGHLKVYDMRGPEVAMLVNGVKQPGEYSVKWNASNIPGGVYFTECGQVCFLTRRNSFC
jgi:hypothetical protein